MTDVNYHKYNRKSSDINEFICEIAEHYNTFCQL